MDEFSSKTACVRSQNWNFEKKLDEFSSCLCDDQENENFRKIRMDDFSSKTVCDAPELKKLNSSWFLMDKFSSKTARLMTRKMKI